MVRKIVIMEHKPTIRVLEILEALAAENQGVSLTHLSEKTGILKGTIFPILKTLVEQRYISYDANTQLYNLGISCSILSRAFLDRSYWLKMVYKEMNNIVKECNEVCQMGIWTVQMFYISIRCRRHKPYNWFHILGLVCLLSILRWEKPLSVNTVINKFGNSTLTVLFP